MCPKDVKEPYELVIKEIELKNQLSSENFKLSGTQTEIQTHFMRKTSEIRLILATHLEEYQDFGLWLNMNSYQTYIFLEANISFFIFISLFYF